MAVRLVVVAYAATAAARELSFGGWSGPVVGDVAPLDRRVVGWVRGPEPAGAETGSRLGGVEVEVLDGLADCDFGSWSGRTLDEVGAADPEALRAWLTDAGAKPPGGESLADLVRRVGEVVDGRSWPEGRSVAVVAPLVARALAVHALGAPPAVIFRIDVGPLGRVEASRSAPDAPWRLQALTPPLRPHTWSP